ncbi:MAG: hypothetical protein ACP5E4_03155, partial [Candidatus Aenigmatarchaeota archaeon]
MISAKDGDTIFVKFSENESLNDLQNVLETYEIKSAFVSGFGRLRVLEGHEKIVDAREAIV